MSTFLWAWHVGSLPGVHTPYQPRVYRFGIQIRLRREDQRITSGRVARPDWGHAFEPGRIRRFYMLLLNTYGGREDANDQHLSSSQDIKAAEPRRLGEQSDCTFRLGRRPGCVTSIHAFLLSSKSLHQRRCALYSDLAPREVGRVGTRDGTAVVYLPVATGASQAE